MEEESVCTSCKKKVSSSMGFTKFMCPNCSKAEIVRCNHCREVAAQYICKDCGFTGPN